ncbi:hypothetical protein V502_07760 [Pseudogymnoascus sp. VKM F-4520 (FW-2644)]|nr:hypothetical protein V502_07760 [Pseudogymnoascus sp. VKM F-4520 (FW-2644)]
MSSSKKEKRMVANVSPLMEILKDEPADYKLAWEGLEREVQVNVKLQIQMKLPTIDASSLLKHEAMEIFKFHKGDELILHDDIYHTPEYFIDMITRIKHITSNSSMYNEAYSRMVLDQILITSIHEKSLASQRGPDEPPSMQHTHPPQLQPSVEEPARLELLHETPLSRKVMYKGEEMILTGSADYILYYELLSYLGIVSASRREQGKENPVVYGIASDGVVFRFCCVNDDGAFSLGAPLDWSMGNHKDCINSMIRKIARTAALSSPSITPILDPARRQLVLDAFGSSSTKVDSGLGRIEFFEIDKDEEEDYIIIGGDSAGGVEAEGQGEKERRQGGRAEEQLLGGTGDEVAAGGEITEAGAKDTGGEKGVTGGEGAGGKRKRDDVGDEEDDGIVGKRQRAGNGC